MPPSTPVIYIALGVTLDERLLASCFRQQQNERRLLHNNSPQKSAGIRLNYMIYN